jgi:hypothetical protein
MLDGVDDAIDQRRRLSSVCEVAAQFVRSFGQAKRQIEKATSNLWRRKTGALCEPFPMPRENV